MNLAVFLPTKHISRYSLLGAMGDELREAFARAGATINPGGTIQAKAGLFVFLNFPENYDNFKEWALTFLLQGPTLRPRTRRCPRGRSDRDREAKLS